MVSGYREARTAKAGDWRKFLVRFGFFPFVAFGVNGLAVAIVFAEVDPGLRAALFLGLMVFLLSISFAAERIAPYNENWNRERGDRGRDWAHFTVNESISLVPALLVPALVFVFAGSAATTSAGGAASAVADRAWLGDAPLWLKILFVVFVFDLGQTLFHWFSHTWRPLWRLHAVHHQVERMYGINGILKHPLYQVLSSVVALAPLVAFGMPPSYSLIVIFLSFSQLLLQHSNVDQRIGPFRRIFATAVVHRFHHQRGSKGDVNFALFFSFFDHLFGNAYFREKRLESDEIGLEDRDYPTAWWAQMKAPFQGSFRSLTSRH